MPLAPSFDTVGWFARDPALFAPPAACCSATGRRAGAGPAAARRGRLRARRARGAGRRSARGPRGRGGARRGAAGDRERGGLDRWHEVFRTLQGAEAWAEHGAWIEQAKPRIGPFLVERLRLAATLDAAEVAAAEGGARGDPRAARRAARGRRPAAAAERALRGAAHRCRDGRARARPRRSSSASPASPRSAACPRSACRSPASPRGRSACRCSPAAAGTAAARPRGGPLARVAAQLSASRRVMTGLRLSGGGSCRASGPGRTKDVGRHIEQHRAVGLHEAPERPGRFLPELLVLAVIDHGAEHPALGIAVHPGLQ